MNTFSDNARATAFYGALETCKRILKDLDATLDAHINKDWGSVGDLHHIAQVLAETLDFMPLDAQPEMMSTADILKKAGHV